MTAVLSRTYVSDRVKPSKDVVAHTTGAFGKRRQLQKNEGLVDISSFKGFTSSLMSKPGKVDPVSWADNVLDLKRDLTLLKHLYLLLEGSNEAMLRVCVELLTCRKSRKAVLWNEEWFDDEERREWFGFQVKEKLRLVLEALGKRAPEDTRELPGLAAERRRANEAEAKLAAADAHVKKLMQSIEDGAKSGSEARAAELEEAAKKHQAQMRDLHKRLNDSEELAQQLQSKLSTMQAELARSEAAIAASAAAAAAAKEDATAARAAEQAQAREREKAEKQAAAVQSKLVTVSAAAAAANERVAAAAGSVSSEEAAQLRRELAEKGRRIKELEDELAKFHAFARKCGLSEEDLKAIAAGLPLPEKVLNIIARAKSAADGDANSSSDVEASSRRASAKNEGGDRSSDEQMAKLRAENKRLKVAIEELQLRLKHLMGECRSSGLDEVPRLVDKVGLGQVVRAKSVWDRLYSDAIRRVDKVKDRQASRAVLEELMPGVSVRHALEESSVPQQLQNLEGLHQPGQSTSHRRSRAQEKESPIRSSPITPQLKTFDSVQQEPGARQRHALPSVDERSQEERHRHTVAAVDERSRWRGRSLDDEVDVDSPAGGIAAGSSARSGSVVERRHRQTAVTFDERSKWRKRTLDDEPHDTARGAVVGRSADVGGEFVARRGSQGSLAGLNSGGGSVASRTAEGGTFGSDPAEAIATRAVFAATATGTGSGMSSNKVLLEEGDGRPYHEHDHEPRRATAGMHNDERQPKRMLAGVGSVTASSSFLPVLGGTRTDHDDEHLSKRHQRQLVSVPVMQQALARQSGGSREASPRERPERQAEVHHHSLNASVSLPSMPVAGSGHDVLAATQMMHLVTGQRRRDKGKTQQFWRP